MNDARPITRIVRIFDVIETTGATLPPRVDFLREVVRVIHRDILHGIPHEDRAKVNRKMNAKADAAFNPDGRIRKSSIASRLSESEIEMMMEARL